ncbi:helix-turn-helix domain-containing protein [Gordonia malaquae]
MTGLTQSEFGAQTEISRRTIFNYETEATRPRPLILKMWALASGVDSHWLETGHAPSPDGDGACRECAIRDSNPEPAD